MRSTFGLVSALAAGLAAFGSGVSSATAGVFDPTTFTLPNGMQVVVIENHRVPIVSHMVWYKVGAADEPEGKSGIAHFLEHLMFKSTATRPAGEFSRLVARHGGTENAFTSQDYTGYFQTVAADRLEMVMEMEAERMTKLRLTQADIDTERQVVLEERSMRTDNNPGSVLREQISAALYLNHPFRRPVIGWEHEIRALTFDEIVGFYRVHYAPNNAVLVIGGDVTAAQIRPLAEKYYGVIPRAQVPPRIRPQEPPHRAARQVVLRDARVGQPNWTRVYLAPSHASGATEHTYPLEVLAAILGRGATSRLNRALVVDQKIAISAGAYYDADGLGPSQLGFYATPQAQVTLDAVQAAMETEIATLLKDGVTEDEVRRAKWRMQADAVYARDSLSAATQSLGSALASGRTVEDVEAWPERIGRVTVDEVNRAARAVIDDVRSVTARLLRKEGS